MLLFSLICTNVTKNFLKMYQLKTAPLDKRSRNLKEEKKIETTKEKHKKAKMVEKLKGSVTSITHNASCPVSNTVRTAVSLRGDDGRAPPTGASKRHGAAPRPFQVKRVPGGSAPSPDAAVRTPPLAFGRAAECFSVSDVSSSSLCLRYAALCLHK